MGLTRHRVLSAAHSLLDRLIPAGPQRVVFTSIPDHADSSFAVYRHLLRTRSSLHITWLVADLEIIDRIEQDFDRITAELPARHGHRLAVRSRHSWRGYIAYLRAAVAFHTHGIFAFARTAHRRQIVSLWHGMPIKAIGRLNTVTTSGNDPHGTVHVATSEMFRYIIAAAFNVSPDVVLRTTLPRTDALLSDDPPGPDDAQIRTRLDLDEDRRLILWMPTYRTQANAGFVYRSDRPAAGPDVPRTFLDDVSPELLDALDRACGSHRCQIVIKLHPLDALNHRSGDQQFDNLRLLTSAEFSASGLQLYDVLAVCDGLMSDLSSVLIDFIPTRRPIGLIGLPFEVYERNLVLPLDLFVRSDRFDHLTDAATVERFVASVTADEHHPGDSFTALLHDEDDLSGTERVLRHVGL